ncbi:MAG: hypothetical protein HQM12_04140 [SAR324 cluster bacterium]|nr:hypothetical protein [SAR324 cluster bacterium]
MEKSAKLKYYHNKGLTLIEVMFMSVILVTGLLGIVTLVANTADQRKIENQAHWVLSQRENWNREIMEQLGNEVLSGQMKLETPRGQPAELSWNLSEDSGQNSRRLTMSLQSGPELLDQWQLTLPDALP